jgi:copper chaperone
MKIFISLMAIFLLLSCQQGNKKQGNNSEVPVSQNMHEETLQIGKMHCEMCVASIEKGLINLDGVVYAKAELDDSIAIVRYDASKTNLAEIRTAIEKRGYTVKDNVPER